MLKCGLNESLEQWMGVIGPGFELWVILNAQLNSMENVPAYTDVGGVAGYSKGTIQSWAFFPRSAFSTAFQSVSRSAYSGGA